MLHCIRLRPSGLITRLARDRRGATIIEFAFCSAAFMALLLGAAQVALIYFAQQSIQTSAEKMARQVMTGEIRTNTMSKDQFRTAACATLPSYMKCSKLYVDVRTASTTGDFSTLDTNMTFTRDSNGNINNGFSYDGGGAGSVVILRLFYAWTTVAGPMGMSLANGDGSDRMLTGTMVFQSEMYQ